MFVGKRETLIVTTVNICFGGCSGAPGADYAKKKKKVAKAA